MTIVPHCDIRPRALPDPLPVLTQAPAFLLPFFAARGIRGDKELTNSLVSLPDFRQLRGVETAAGLLAAAIMHDQHIVVIGDYDADGATATALAVRSLCDCGAQRVSYFVPDRFHLGYGLSPALVAAIVKLEPQVLLTVDNGIANIAGAQAAREAGYQLIITDHHLPGGSLPQADAVVNPNQPDCDFPSKNLAGVGVAFYTMIALRAHLIAQRWFTYRGEQPPNLAHYLDLVALGTIADMVILDHTNRILVEQGLRRIRAGHLQPGVRALLSVSNRMVRKICARDLAFAVAPRLNAAGRMRDMRIGIDCLTTTDYATALRLAQQLEQCNRQRKDVEKQMHQQAQAQVDQQIANLQEASLPAALCLFDPEWHEGVVGIIAGRMKDYCHRPVIAFACAQEEGKLKGSARSIEGLHLRDLLAEIAHAHPSLLICFGGHAMAAGLTLERSQINNFAAIFSDAVRVKMGKKAFTRCIMTDGTLSEDAITIEHARLLRFHTPWGQGFPQPQFEGEFMLLHQRLWCEQHLHLVLQIGEGGCCFEAIYFHYRKEMRSYPLQSNRVHAVYTLDLSTACGTEQVRMQLCYLAEI